MRRQVHPLTATLVILAVVLAVGYLTWRATMPTPPASHISGMARVRQPDVREKLIQNYQQRWQTSADRHR